MSKLNGHKVETFSPSPPKKLDPEIKVRAKSAEKNNKFGRSPVLRQSPALSRAIVWGLVTVTTTVVVWANIARMEEAVSTQGKLEPQATVKEVQVPLAGVVKAVYVKDGQKVRRGDLLLKLDSAVVQAQLASLQKICGSLIQENQFYRAQLQGQNTLAETEILITRLNLPIALASLTKSRAEIVAENRLYRAQFQGTSQGANLTPEQEIRLEFSQAEFSTKINDVKLEAEQLEKQLAQTEAELENAKNVLNVNRTILNSLEPLVKEGAISRVQGLKQQQEVGSRQADVEKLTQEQARIRFAIAQSKEKLKNTIATANKDLLVKISDNEKQIAQIDSQLNKAILENEKKIAEIEGQMTQAKVNLQYQELRATADGIVFDLQARSPGFVANPSQPVMKIVPDEDLVAKVYITNKDIGFLREGMKVDVRIDSFPFSEFGDIKGELIWIGSDALPPEQIRPYYSFPAKIRLDRQYLISNNRKLTVQSGMSITANIKVRDRSVISIFTELFTKNFDNLKNVR